MPTFSVLGRMYEIAQIPADLIVTHSPKHFTRLMPLRLPLKIRTTLKVVPRIESGSDTGDLAGNRLKKALRSFFNLDVGISKRIEHGD